MRKQKPNRASKKTRKMIKRTAAYDRRKSTQWYQKQAARHVCLNPRGLARSVARYLRALRGEPAEKMGGAWRALVIQLPKTGRKRIYPATRRAAVAAKGAAR